MRKIEMVGFKEFDEHFWISFTFLSKMQGMKNLKKNFWGIEVINYTLPTLIIEGKAKFH